MQDELNNLILKNYELSKYIEELSSKIEIKDNCKRDMLLVGFFNNVRNHFYSMNLLIEKKLYNSSFALVRIFFENIIKARYVYMFFDDAIIEKMYGKDDWDSIFKKKLNLGYMCKAIDTKIGENFYETIKNNAYKKMNDFTHTGAYQIASNFNIIDGLVEPSFGEELIKDTLRGNFELMKTFSLFSLEILGLHNEYITKDEMDKLLSNMIVKRDKFQYLYKYTPHNTEYKYDILSKSQVWFSKVESFNDPIDSKLNYRQQYTSDEILQYWKNFLANKPDHPQTIGEILQESGENSSFINQQNRVFKDFKAQIGVLCFSVNPKNILMWSHYADHHKGIVYEFKKDLFLETESIHPYFKGKEYKVEYPNDRSYELLSYTKIGQEKNDQFAKELTIKARDWACEEEYRMIDLEKSGNKKFNSSSLHSIIFGARTSIDEIDMIKCLCKKLGLNHIKFKKAKFIEGRFELEFIDI